MRMPRSSGRWDDVRATGAAPRELVLPLLSRRLPTHTVLEAATAGRSELCKGLIVSRRPSNRGETGGSWGFSGDDLTTYPIVGLAPGGALYLTSRTFAPSGALHEMTPEVADLYALLVDRVTDYAVFALDPRGCILTWNAGAERLKGYRVDEIVGRHFSIFYPPEDVAAGKPARELEIAVAVGQAKDEGWRVRKDGSRFWADVLITALRNDGGELVGFGKITRDLTERRLALDTLRKSDERFRLFVESVKDYAIFMLEPSGRIATWNEGARRIKGYTEEEIIGKHFSIFYPLEDSAAGKPSRELVIATETGEYKEEGWRVRKDGARFWASVVITAVRDAKGVLAGFAKVTHDLTERRAAEGRAVDDAFRLATEEAARTAAEQQSDELRSLTAQLHVSAAELERRRSEAEAANRVKSEFLAAMSHELRTPLNAIGGYAQLLEMGISGPVTRAQGEQLARIQRSQTHLLGIIDDILSFSRVEAGHVSYVTAPVPIGDVAEAVIPMVVPQARSKHIRLQPPVGAASIVADADRAKVEQILLNLLSNAVKFTPAHGEIELACGATDDIVWLSVRDTGIGIPADQLDAIFTPFVQVGRALARPKEGTGLGLSISRELARGMHGNVTASSCEGSGSTFTLTLPRHAAPRAAPQPAPAAARKEKRRKEKGDEPRRP
jgi:PAS domain S-box-containing protein